MHELSIAESLVDAACAAARDAGATRVTVVHARIGALSGVVPDALQFGYDITTDGTLLQGSRLDIIAVPVAVRCAACGRESVLPGIQDVRCPACGAGATSVIRGREIELVSIEADVP